MDKYNCEKIPSGIFDKVKDNKQKFVEKFIDDLEELFPRVVKDNKIDGGQLEIFKLLRDSYYEKTKMIYIDIILQGLVQFN